MTGEALISTQSLPKKLLDYISEVEKRSGVKLDVARAHAGTHVQRRNSYSDQLQDESMDYLAIGRPRSKSGFQVTSPLAQRRTVADHQRPKSAYQLNGHCEFDLPQTEDSRDGYHTDGENTSCQLRIPDYVEYIEQYKRRCSSPACNISGADNFVNKRLSSTSTISEDDDVLDSRMSYMKTQSDIGTLWLGAKPVDPNDELLEKIQRLEQQNEMLKQRLTEKTMKDEAVQVHQYTAVPIQPITVKRLVSMKFKQQLEDAEGIDSGTQIFNVFMDSERTYVNGLLTLVRQFFLPMKMFSACRPHVLPLLQLDGIFLNCEQLLLYHQSMFSAMLRVDHCTDAQISSEFLNVLDKFLPGLTVYAPFLAVGQQTFEQEFRSTMQNVEVCQLLHHCEELSHTSLDELFTNIFQRFDHYKHLLVLFLRLPESNEPREDQVCNMIDYIKALTKELTDATCDWNVMTTKMKILQSITDSSMLPVEIFDTDVHYIKQGNLLHVVGETEFSCVCLLFTTHVALANRTTDSRIEIVNPGMMALCGAVLHDQVDITGHPLQDDFQSGLRKDQLGFKILFHNKQGIYLRVSKPNHLRDWLQHFSEAISHAHKNCSCKASESSDRAGIDLGPRIAAASLEKLFQQLTNPLNTNKEFLDTFFMTYRLFTTAEDVLTALINCLLQKNDTSKNRLSDEFEVFNYHSSAANSDDDEEEEEEEEGIIASPSMDTLDSISSNCLANGLSEQDSPTTSQQSSPVTTRKTFVSRPGPRRAKKASELTGAELKPSTETSDTFATARDTVKPVKRRYSHDEGVPSVNKVISYKRSLVRACSDSNIVENLPLSPQRSRKLSSQSDSSNSLSNYHHVAPIGTLSPPLVAISPSEDEVTAVERRAKMKRQLTSDTSRSFSTSSEQFGDIESEDETVLSPEPCDPTPRVSVQLPVPLNDEVNANGNLVSEMVKRFPVLRSTTSPVLSTISHSSDLSHSLPNDLNMIGLGHLSGEDFSIRKERAFTVTGSMELMTSSGNSWLTKPVEGRVLSEIHEDSAESRASTKSPSPPPAGTLRARSDAFIETNRINITRLDVISSDSMNRRFNAAQHIENAREITRSRVNENGRRGSIFARLLGKTRRHQSETDEQPLTSGKPPMLDKGSQAQPIPIRATSPSPFDAYPSSLPSISKSTTPKFMKRFSVLRRRKEVTETLLSPTRDFSLLGGRLSPSPGARYGDQVIQQRTVMFSIYSNLNYWLRAHKEDFIYNKELKQKLMSSLEGHLEKVASRDQQQMELAEDTIQKLKEVTSDVMTDKSLTNMLMKTIQPEFGMEMLGWVEMTEQSLCNASVVNLNPKQLARQLMLLEYALYAAIERRELIGCCWKHKNKEVEAPNICRVIKQSNKLTSWVMTAIIQQEAVQARAAAIELFIKVASECWKHNDAQSCVLITCALNSCCVRHDRLRLSWEQVSGKLRQKFDKMVKFSNPDRRCRSMRAHLEKQHPPGVPYTGGYLEHIWAIENGQQTYTPDGLVNFAKMTALCSAVRSYLRFHAEPYNFEPDFKLMHYIVAAERLDDEQLYHLSKEREP